MSESRNVRVMLQLVKALNEYDFDRVQSLVTDDLVVEQPFAALGQPERYQGREAFVCGLRFIPTMFEEFRLEPTAVYDCPDEDSVVFEQSSQGVFKVDGSPYHNQYLMIFTFRDGKVCRWVEHYDPKVMTELMTPIVAKMAAQTRPDSHDDRGSPTT